MGRVYVDFILCFLFSEAFCLGNKLESSSIKYQDQVQNSQAVDNQICIELPLYFDTVYLTIFNT